MNMPTPQTTAWIFPGQGAQYPGIGRDIHAQCAAVRDTYAEASDALGYDVAALSFAAAAANGDAKINLTRYTQPVLLTHSIACLRALQDEVSLPTAAMAGGHSLGEYSALVSAGALAFATTVKLVQRRGELMGKYGRGEMEALSLDYESAAELASRHHCEIAGCNLPEQNVVGGTAADLDALIAEMTEKFPRKRSTRLKTEGAFHTFYMVEAARKFRQTLAETQFTPPQFPILSNFSGGFHEFGDAGEAIKSRLFLQLFKPVLWHRNLCQMDAAGAELLIEFGGGIGSGEAAERRPNLEGIVKRAWRGAARVPNYLSVINANTLQSTAAALGSQ